MPIKLLSLKYRIKRKVGFCSKKVPIPGICDFSGFGGEKNPNPLNFRFKIFKTSHRKATSGSESGLSGIPIPKTRDYGIFLKLLNQKSHSITNPQDLDFLRA